MPLALRWLAKALWWIVTALLFYIGVTEDIPEWVTGQIPLLSSIGGETFIRGLAVVLAFVVGLVAAGPQRVQAWPEFATRYLRSRKSDERLKERCRHLSAEIYQFMADRDRDDRSMERWYEGTGAKTEEERHQNWVNQGVQRDRHFTETMSRYRERYEGPVMALFDDLEERGWVTSGERFHPFEHPTNPLGIQEVARRLGVIGHRQ